MEKDTRCILVIVYMASDFSVARYVAPHAKRTAAGTAEAFDEA